MLLTTCLLMPGSLLVIGSAAGVAFMGMEKGSPLMLRKQDLGEG